ncbi:hypothetical protein [Halorhabdus sp. BNX81]|uniref:hypothetical protein n=1 Tax=Halorhabdus sp. BNX81 TaxID=2980181 RepID=UPI0023DD45B8|nr:hypothetical protein [Halorhabdus sp. BNX81]
MIEVVHVLCRNQKLESLVNILPQAIEFRGEYDNESVQAFRKALTASSVTALGVPYLFAEEWLEVLWFSLLIFT